ncbi:MAG: cyclic nucleotide-binding domain-containing protein [Spirochaetaceae bacterium]|jgi:CRP-like cAMP-binding protein|nr:cyclic nucleotide-binding domain-containing protein [Spirochaetaceae bacterium]
MAEKPQLSIISYNKGMFITIEGNRNNHKFFIIQSGNVRISTAGSSRFERDHPLLKQGDFFGVLSAMTGRQEIETAKAETDVVLVAVQKTQFEGLIQFNTPVAIKIIQQFSRQMRTLNNTLSERTTKNEDTEDTEVLYRNALYYQANKEGNKAFYCYKQYIEHYPNAPNRKAAIESLKDLQQYNRHGYTVAGSPFIRKYPRNNIICSEGESGEDMYIIQMGCAKITKIANGAEVILAVLNPGDIFGEMALLESKPRSATAAAIEDCTVMVVSKSNFEALAASKPQIVSRLTQMLADRIWFNYKVLANMHIPDAAGRFFDMLCIHLEKERVPLDPFTAYAFNLTIEQLMKMANIQPSDKRHIMAIINDNQKIKLILDKLITSDVTEIIKLAEFYKKQAARRTR